MKAETQVQQYVVYRRRWVVLLLYAAYCTLSAAQWLQLSIITIIFNLICGCRDDMKAETQVQQYVVYRRRWVVLLLYAAYCTLSAAQWLQLSIITDVITHYYGVTTLFVNWTSIIFMLAYVITIIPATWFFNRKGARAAILLGTGGTCLGAWVKVFSVSPDLFWLTFLGQSIVAFSQMYVLSIPAPLAAIWFDPDQVATACSIGIFGTMLGNALGFIVPVLMVPNDGDIPAIENGLSYMFYGTAILLTILLILQILFLKSQPPTPPSAAQANRDGVAAAETPRQFVAGMWALLKSKDFVLLFLAYGLNGGVFAAITTFMSQMILVYYPDAQDHAGFIGMTLLVTGLLGLILIGYVLDKTKKYKEAKVILFGGSALAMLGYTLLLQSGLVVIYVMAAILGFLMIGYWPAAFEFAAELTYPTAEATTVGVLALGGQIFAWLYTMAYGWVFNPFGDLAANLFMTGSLALGTVFTVLTKSKYRRQQAALLEVD